MHNPPTSQKAKAWREQWFKYSFCFQDKFPAHLDFFVVFCSFNAFCICGLISHLQHWWNFVLRLTWSTAPNDILYFLYWWLNINFLFCMGMLNKLSLHKNDCVSLPGAPGDGYPVRLGRLHGISRPFSAPSSTHPPANLQHQTLCMTLIQARWQMQEVERKFAPSKFYFERRACSYEDNRLKDSPSLCGKLAMVLAC